MRRLGVVGTMVWDTIYGRGAELEPAEEWGGISYALAALEATLPDGWCIVPLIKVGYDLAPRANEFLNSLTRRAGAARFIEVPQPNNRVTLRYEQMIRRTEHLSGGVPPWTWEELGPMVRDLNALYVNFISGFEMKLETAQHLRTGFSGPIYADLHSLFLGVEWDGLRVPEALPGAFSWFACFDAIQLNEDEMRLVGDDPMEVTARALAAGVRLLVVTLGPRGTTYFALPSFEFSHGPHKPPAAAGPIRTARIPAEFTAAPLDPTGCGDVFGATIVSHLLSGTPLEDAIRHANRLAARNLSFRGATQLHEFLREGIVLR